MALQRFRESGRPECRHGLRRPRGRLRSGPVWRTLTGLLVLTLLGWSGAGSSLVDEGLVRRVQADFGVEAAARVEAWRELIDSGAQRPETEKLDAVNRFFNQLDFVSDEEHWGISDYWATPTEFLSTGGGDCEDFSIAKYFTLREMGVPVDRLRLTYVKALQPNPVSQAHMVLTYFSTPDAEPLVLDNLVPGIKQASRRPDLVPVYSFNGSGLWVAKQRGRGILAGDSSRVSRWVDLVSRMGAEQRSAVRAKGHSEK